MSASTELLDQFILEARECLEQIGQRLLDVEKEPGNRELLNDLFRQVHTLKGNCGLFDFKALERVVHAGEDLLDRVRNGSLAYNGDIADALLAAMDYTAELVDAIAEEGAQPASSDGRSQELASALRRHLDGPAAAPAAAEAPAAAPAASATSPVAPLPAWLADLPADFQRHGLTALRYTPDADCFFKGEDPWHLARSTPGLQHLMVRPAGDWAAAADFDCYHCNLELVVVSDAPRAYIEEHYRYVPDQICCHALEAAPSAGSAAAAEDPSPAQAAQADPVQALLRVRIGRIWDDQRALLARPGIAAGTVAATRRTFSQLIGSWGDEALAASLRQSLEALPAGATPLAAWALQHRPGGGASDEAPAVGHTIGAPVAPGAALVAPPEPRRGGNNPGTDDASGGAGGAQKVLKVAQDKIDRLMDLIGEMVVAKNALPYLANRAETVFNQRELAREIKTQYSVINRIAEDMQHAIMQVRMLPVGTVFQRFGRLVRDISKKLGKEVNLVIEGEDTEADKNVIESLADPLIHILRNSLDHGIELPAVRVAAGKPAVGTLRVAARQEGDRVILDITDDGAGIDTERVRNKAVERGLIPADRAGLLTEHEAVQLVFLPGFSTAEAISDLSGRGVGMDVVRSAVERINGSVELSSTRGQGTQIRLALPLSMAVTNVMMIETAGRRFGVPMDLIVETVRVPAEDIHHFKSAQTVVLRGRIVPLRALNELLALDEPPRMNADGEHAVLVVRLGNENVGLLVDDFHGTSDIILKPLEGVLTGITGFAGTALMGDGSVLMILNPKELS
ncbi:chemotaxis protein CheA [Ideonella sp. DXS22W]|uniref:histidine kinase n=1 Tax=Pseudaquabacterium inlustre TaxID=2984192 RepID=A0ABU9CKK9_9BURK